MYPSTLITGRDSSSALSLIKKIISPLGHASLNNNPDVFTINESTGWGIDTVRSIRHFLSQKPFNHSSKLVLIFEAQNLGVEAQNALLKTLEEPGNNNYIILTASTTAALLPTILSRCRRLNNQLTQAPHPEELIQITGLLATDLQTAESISADKNQILPYLDNQLALYRQRLAADPSIHNLNLIKKISLAITMIKSNVDPRSALDYLFLS